MSGIAIREDAPEMAPVFPAKSAATKAVLAIWFLIWLPVMLYLVHLTGYDSLVSSIWAAWWTGMTLGIALGIAEKFHANHIDIHDKITNLFHGASRSTSPIRGLAAPAPRAA